MKYEITKGSEKDFSDNPDSVLTVYRLKGSRVEHFSAYPSDEFAIGVNIIAERRPITETELKPIYGDGIHDDTEALQQRIDMGIDINSVIGEQRKLFKISKPLQFGVGTDSVVNQQLTTEWDGEGVAPVGALCRYRAFSDMPWVECKVLGWHDDEVWLKRADNGITFVIGNPELFPVRSPEDVARSNAIGEMERAYEELTGKPAREAEEYYDFIAAGKITGVNIVK